MRINGIQEKDPFDQLEKDHKAEERRWLRNSSSKGKKILPYQPSLIGVCENTSIWARVLFQKYCSPRRVLNLNTRNKSCSSTWLAIRKGEKVFKKGTKWVDERDINLSLWHDKRMDKGTLRNQIVGPLNREEDGLLLKDVVNYLGWNWQNLSFSLPDAGN